MPSSQDPSVSDIGVFEPSHLFVLQASGASHRCYCRKRLLRRRAETVKLQSHVESKSDELPKCVGLI